MPSPALLTPAALLPLLERYWGYDSFLPDQEAAIEAVLGRRDSLVVMPTGGGKSVIYQLPALAGTGLGLVVSPLISLMADQVYGLTTVGIPAATFNSSKSPEERRQIAADVREGRLKLLYVSPEALMAHGDGDSNFLLDLLGSVSLSFVAIDEAHCISQWGHDFWPSYRKLGTLRDRFGSVPIHAFTATATPRVRADIVASLGLRDPLVLVGDFDRPNLTYRVLPRKDLLPDIAAVLERHVGEAGVIYCGTRDEVDTVSVALASKGHKALGYHAGLSPEVRKERQEAFMRGEADLMVATVAFGMGIDRSDVRFIVHAAMPPSVENYSQEAGRAGRDRLPAECVLLYSAQDLMMWKRRKGEPHTDVEREGMARVHEIFRFASSLTCRHRFLVQYFGQAHSQQSCGACDVCLGERQAMPDSLPVAQMLLEGVRQVRESFGSAYVAEVLHGASTTRIKDRRHDTLGCYGSMARHETKDIRSWLDQLLAQGFLAQGDYAVLRLTPEGRELLESHGEVRLSSPPAKPKSTKSRSTAGGDNLVALGPQEEELFQALRAWRAGQARERNWPAYMVFSDLTLRELSRIRPSSLSELSRVKGIGELKRTEFGPPLLEFLAVTCEDIGFSGAPEAPVGAPVTPVAAPAPPVGAVEPAAPGPDGPPGKRAVKGTSDGLSGTVKATLDLKREGLDPEAIARKRNFTLDTILAHLGVLVEKGLVALDAVVSPASLGLIEEAVALIGLDQPLGALRALVPMAVPYGALKMAVDEMKRRESRPSLRDPALLARVQWLIDLGQAPDPEATADIQACFGDPDAIVRSLALHAYGSLEDVTLEPVIAVLDRETEPLVRQSALRTLARRGSPDLAPVVEAVAADSEEDPGTRLAAEATLSRWRKAAMR